MHVAKWLMDSLKYMSRDAIEKVTDVLIIGDKGKARAPRDDHGHYYKASGAPCPHKSGKGGTGNNSREKKWITPNTTNKTKRAMTYHEKFSKVAEKYIKNGELSDKSVDKIISECDNISADELMKEAMSGGRHSGLIKQIRKMNEKSLRKGIRTQRETIDVHKSWLKDPSLYPHQERIQTKEQLLHAKMNWLNDIQRNTEEVLLKERALEERG